MYDIWSSIKSRCARSSADPDKIYEAKGITMDPAWRQSFAKFLEDVGPRPSKKHSLGRLNKKEGFCPENVRWMTAPELMHRVSINKYLSFEGETLSIADWGRKLGMSPNRLAARINRGWSVEDALSTPVEKVRISDEERGRRVRASYYLNYALRRGRLIRPPICSECLMPAKTQGHHHNGYSEEHLLDVIWLCRKCHTNFDADRRRSLLRDGQSLTDRFCSKTDPQEQSKLPAAV